MKTMKLALLTLTAGLGLTLVAGSAEAGPSRRADLNRDGVVSLSEARRAGHVRASAPRRYTRPTRKVVVKHGPYRTVVVKKRAVAPRRRFAPADLNRDGFVSRRELRIARAHRKRW